MARIYLDNCCLGRLFDEQDQSRVRFEADAVMVILELIQAGHVTWVSSQTLADECSQNSDPEARQWAESILEHVDVVVNLESCDEADVMRLEQAGIGSYDAMHLVAAEKGRCETLLTTDDRLIKKAARACADTLDVIVMNPVDWLWRRNRENT